VAILRALVPVPLAFAHEALTSGADERHRLREEHPHGVTKSNRLLVRRTGRLHLSQCSPGQLDRCIERQGCELLPLSLLHRFRLLLRELAQAAEEILWITAEGKSTFH
jgi:hypothetical protein